MKKINKLKKLLYPHPAIILILVPLSIAMLVYTFIFQNEDIVAYISYFLSAYALTVVCLKIPYIIRKANVIKNTNPYIQIYLNNVNLRIKISLYFSLFMNTCYGIFQLGLGFFHKSLWFYSFAAYYIMLAIMRYFLLHDIKLTTAEQNAELEFKRYRFCGILLLIMNLSLMVIVFFMPWLQHHFITTIAMAAYTFWSFSKAIVQLIKYKKYNSPLFSATKIISLAAASVSLLTLENAMLTAFGSNTSEFFKHIMTTASGLAVCTLILVIATFMIIYANIHLKKLNENSEFDSHNPEFDIDNIECRRYMVENNNNSFTYSYSAKQQKEINEIRNKYTPKKTDKIDLIRKLDNQVTQKATAYSLISGIVGALILGTGMSCCMVWNKNLIGIIIGILGIILISISYPLYNLTLKRERNRIAPQILKLTDEVLNNSEKTES